MTARESLIYYSLPCQTLWRYQEYPHLNSNCNGWKEQLPWYCIYCCRWFMHNSWCFLHCCQPYQTQVCLTTSFQGKLDTDSKTGNLVTIPIFHGITITQPLQPRPVEIQDDKCVTKTCMTDSIGVLALSGWLRLGTCRETRPKVQIWRQMELVLPPGYSKCKFRELLEL